MSGPENAAPPVREGLFREDPPALIGSRCDRCGALRFPALEVCAECQGAVSTPVELATEGTVFTYTIVRAAPPGYAGEVPYAVGVVELPGLRLAATLLAADLGTIAIGAACELEIFDLDADGGGRLRTYGFRIREE